MRRDTAAPDVVGSIPASGRPPYRAGAASEQANDGRPRQLGPLAVYSLPDDKPLSAAFASDTVAVLASGRRLAAVRRNDVMRKLLSLAALRVVP